MQLKDIMTRDVDRRCSQSRQVHQASPSEAL